MVGRERSYTSSDGEMAAQTHSRSAYTPTAGGKAEEVIDSLARVLIVRLEGLQYILRQSALTQYIIWGNGIPPYLRNLPLVSLVGARHIVGQCLWAREVVI